VGLPQQSSRSALLGGLVPTRDPQSPQTAEGLPRKLKAYLPGILAHCEYPLHTSLLEGINNKIKVIKCMAYGYRDDEYFCLKIRAAFLGNGR